MIQLSERLGAVAGLVTPGSRTADVGCDHGYVSIRLVEQGVSPHVIAMDINRGPLARADEHIAAHGLTQYIETRLSDGVAALREGEADSLVLAGMGGRLMLRILQDGHSVTDVMNEWILQPQSELALFRRTLRHMGAVILEEAMVEEDGKFYPILRVRPPGRSCCPKQTHTDKAEAQEALWQEACDSYGPKLLQQRNRTLLRYLNWEEKRDDAVCRKLEKCAGSQRSPERLTEFMRRRQVRQRALRCFAEAEGACPSDREREGQSG